MSEIKRYQNDVLGTICVFGGIGLMVLGFSLAAFLVVIGQLLYNNKVSDIIAIILTILGTAINLL